MTQSNAANETSKTIATISGVQTALVAVLTAINDTATDTNTPAINAIRECLKTELVASPTLLMFAMKGMDYWAKEGLNDMSKQATETDKINYRRSLTVAHIAGFWTRKQHSDSLKPATAKTKATGKRGTIAIDYAPLIVELRALALTALRIDKKGKRIEGYEPAIGAKLITHIDRLTTELNKPALLDLWAKNATLRGLLTEAQATLTARASKEAERLAAAEAIRIAELADFSDLD